MGRIKTNTLFLIALFLQTSVVQTNDANAGEKTTLGKRVATAQQIPMELIDHAAWDTLLKKYVDVDGKVDYATWKQTPADITALNQYLASLSSASPQTTKSRKAAIAFWINTYNAVTVQGILKEYPTSSIRNHTAKLFGYNIWHDLLIQVGDRSYSLDTIEHKILRPTKEYRIHFAIVCASISCPRLRNEAYTPTTLEAQLADNTRDFFSRSQNLSIRDSTVNVSSILDWFAEDFGSTPQSGLMALAKYLPESAKRVVVAGRFQVAYLPYDWGLNEQNRVRSARR